MASSSCPGDMNFDENMSHLHLLVIFEQLIEDCLCPTHLLSSMPSMRVFAAEIRKKEQQSRIEAVQMFLRLLKEQYRNGVKGWYQEFINALQENGFEILYNSLEGFGDVKHQEAYKTLLTMHYQSLTTKVRPTDIMPYLIQTEALNTHDAETIEKCCRNESRQNAMIVLLDLLSKKKESWFQDLIYALKQGECEELAEKIIPEIAKTSGDENSVKETVDRVIQANSDLGAGSSPCDSTYQKTSNTVSDGTIEHEFKYHSVPAEIDLESPNAPDKPPSPDTGKTSASLTTAGKGKNTDEDAPESLACPEFPPAPKTNSPKCAIVAPMKRTDPLKEAAISLDLNGDEPNRPCSEANMTGCQEQLTSVANQITGRSVRHIDNNNGNSAMATSPHIDQSGAGSVSSSSQNELSPNMKSDVQNKSQLYERKELNVPLNLETSLPEDADLQSNVDNTSVRGTQVVKPEPEDLKLRGYQMELAKTAVEGKNVIVEAPTGSGKTHVAMYITKKHFENADFADEPKVIFLVPTVALVTQQLNEFKKYISDQQSLGISGEMETLPLNELLPGHSIIVLTPAILLDALKAEAESISLSQLTLLIFDECHHTTKGHPYNEIMAMFIEQKLAEDAHPVLPQVVGLTASVGVGKAKTQDKAQEHIIRLMANMDAEKLCTVNDPRNKLELAKHVNRPDEATLEVYGRKADPFNKIINSLMEKIEYKMKTAPEVSHANREVAGFQELLQAPPVRGSEQYIQWLSRLDKPIAKIHLQTTRRLFFACHSNLKAYNNALLINSDCRTKDALAFLKKEFKELTIPQSDDTDKWLEQIFKEKEAILQSLSEDPAYDNPKLHTIKEKLLEVFTPKPDSRAIIFVKTREMTKALVNWMKETPELQDLNGFPLTGAQAASTRGGMTQNKQDDVVKYFRQGKHKVIVATSVAEEGLDIRKCNLVIKYEHVTNEIAMVQTRGRGRDEDSEYLVIGEKGGGIMERERANKIKESMMSKAVKAIQSFQGNKEQIKKLLHKYQVEARLERQMKAQGKQTEEEIREARQLRGEYQLRCLKCDALAAFSSDFRKIEVSHHVILDPEFEERINVETHPQPKEYGQFQKTGKIYCLKCNYDWGIMALYRKARFPVLKLVSFILVDPKDQRNTCKKWKDAPFSVEPISPEDISLRLSLMASEQAQAASDD